MCTLSFIPGQGGYTAGMNRDELRSRPRALFPRIYERGGLVAAYPSEPESGTWVGVNGNGTLLALLNWNLGKAGAEMAKQRSRGELIPDLIFKNDFKPAENALHGARLGGMLPFRLVGIDPQPETVREWRWNGKSVETLEFPWARRHWFSSSLSDSVAEEQRGAICEALSTSGMADSPDWLPEFHRSHRPAAGAYSLCVHRPDAVTVSYTEVIYGRGRITMRYIEGSPCESAGFHQALELPCASSRLCSSYDLHE
jgi:hypothetical protein